MDVNCRNFKCKFNAKGECCLESITLQDDESSIINKVICIEAEPGDVSCNGTDLPRRGAKPLDHETVWGTPKVEGLPV